MGIFFTSQPFFRKVCLSVCFTLLKQFTSCLDFIPKFLISDIIFMLGATILRCQGRIPVGLYELVQQEYFSIIIILIFKEFSASVSHVYIAEQLKPSLARLVLIKKSHNYNQFILTTYPIFLSQLRKPFCYIQKSFKRDISCRLSHP